MFFLAHIIKKTKSVNGILLVILMVTMLVPFSTFGVSSAAYPDDPSPLSIKWTGFVAGGGEALLTCDVLPGTLGEEVFHAGGGYKPAQSGGSVTCLNGINGTVIWKTGQGGVPALLDRIGDTCQIHMVDMDLDGTMEIVVPLQSPAGLYILNAESGTVQASFTSVGGGRIDSSPVSGDVDGDGYPDLYIGVMAYVNDATTGKIIHYEYNGNSIVERGRVQVWHPCAGGLSLCDTDHDGTVELYMNERDIYYNGEGTTWDGSYGRGITSFWAENLTKRWQVYDWGASSNIPMLADVNNDGIIDVVTTDLSRSVCVLNSTDGHPLMNGAITLSGSNNRANHYQSSIYDIDRDGNLEIVSGDGYESRNDYVSVWDLWDWTLDARIDTTAVETKDNNGAVVSTRSWKGPTFGEVTGDGMMDMLVVTFTQEDDDSPTVNNGTLQIYSWNIANKEFDLVHLNYGLRHRAIDAVVQDVDRNDDGLNEVLVLTQGGQIVCFESNGIASSPRARSEIQFYSELRNGASENIPYEQPYPIIKQASPGQLAINVATSTTQLRFTLDHPLDLLMDYTVTSTPDIITGGASGNDVGNGQRIVNIADLEESTEYRWQVSATDSAGHTTSWEYIFNTAPTKVNDVPTQSTPYLSSEIGGNTVYEDITNVNVGTSDPDVGDSVTNIYNWRKGASGGTSIANLNLAFDTQPDTEALFSGLATTRDYSGRNPNVEVLGCTWMPDGKVGGAFQFDGDDLIRVAESSNRLDGGGGSSGWNGMSVEFWVKATVPCNERLLWKTDQYDNALGNVSYRVDYQYSTNPQYLRFTWYVYTGTELLPVQYSVTCDVTTAVTDWHHIVCTYESGDGLRIFVDGIQAAANVGPAITGTILNTVGPLNIAFQSGGDFRGILDELRIYPYEVSSIYAYQRYMDTNEGDSSKSTIPAGDLTVGDVWQCQVTPNDGKTDGTTLTSNVLNVVAGGENTAPEASNLEIIPAAPYTTDALVAQYDYNDLEGHLELDSEILWYKTSDVTPSYSGKTLPAYTTAKGEEWHFTVRPKDGFIYGTLQTSPSVTILNSPPSFTSVLITPSPAFAGSNLLATCSGWSDADGDTEAYNYQWQKLVGANWQNVGGNSPTLLSTNFARGDYIKVIVTANDGEELGNVIEALTWIVDSDPPTVDGATLVSASGNNRDDDELTCTPVNPQDAEEDVTVIYKWLRNGNSYTNLLMPFDSNSSTTATDYSGYGNHGTVYGATPAEGVVGGAYSFDGNDNIRVQESGSTLGGEGTWSEISVEFWIKTASTSTETVIAMHDELYSLGGYMGGSYGVGYRVDYRGRPDGYQVYWYIYPIGDVPAQSTNFRVYEGAGQWHHVVCTYESGVGLNLYTDGILRSSVTGVGNINATVDDILHIGGLGSVSGDFNGQLDGVKIYPTALSAAQVFQNYADSAEGLSDSATIVPQETSKDETWSCQVTPNDGYQDGTPRLSNTLTITSNTNTKPHIDYCTPVDTTPYAYVGDTLNFAVLASDPNEDTLTYKWYVDSVEQVGETSAAFSYSPTSNTIVEVEVSDGLETDSQQWNIEVGIQEYTLTITTEGQGSVSKNPDQTTYLYGDTVTLTATPEEVGDWEFVGWSGDVVSTDNPLQITITGDTEITATFTDQYILTVNVIGQGLVTKTPDLAGYAHGTEVELLAVPADGWTFSGWSGALSGSTNPTSITMDDHKTVTASFTQDIYILAITVNPLDTGSVSTSIPAPYHYGDVVTLTPTAYSGYTFAGWTGAGVDGADETRVITFTGNVAVTATFEPSGFFNDDFESGDTSEWTGVDNVGSVVVNTNRPYQGTYSLGCSLSAAANNVWAGVYESVSGNNPIYLKAQVFINGPPDTDTEEQWVLAFTEGTAGIGLAYAGIQRVSGTLYWAIWYYSGTTLVYQVSSSVYSEGWHSLELAINRGTSNDGWVELNVDDALTCSAHNIDNDGRVLNYARVGYSYSDAPTAAISTLYIDDVIMSTSQTPPTYDINLTSQEDDISTQNLGTITCQGTNYALPSTVTKQAGLYSVEYTAATGYSFDRWETTGAVTVADPNSAATTFTVSGDCTLTAIYLEEPVESAYLVVRGLESQIWYRQYDAHSTVWSEWSALPSGMAYDSVATVVCNNKLYLTTQAMDGLSLWFSWVDLADNSFSGWTAISGLTPSPPTLTCSEDKLYLVVRGLENQVWYREYDTASVTWSDWVVLPSGMAYDSIAATVCNGKLYLTAQAMDGLSLWFSSIDLGDKTFSGWNPISGLTPSAPTLVSSGDKLFLVVRGLESQIWYREYDCSSETWSDWIQLPSGAAYDSIGAAASNGKLYLTVQAMDGLSLWFSWVDLADNSFSGWTAISGLTPSPPTLTSS